jgi:hypothetical protein
VTTDSGQGTAGGRADDGDYTIGAICAPVAVVAVELTALCTGIQRRPRFWVTIAITLAFQAQAAGSAPHRAFHPRPGPAPRSEEARVEVPVRAR